MALSTVPLQLNPFVVMPAVSWSGPPSLSGEQQGKASAAGRKTKVWQKKKTSGKEAATGRAGRKTGLLTLQAYLPYSSLQS